MKFEDFIKSGQAKRSSRDIQLAKSLISTSDDDLLFLKGLELKDISARKIVSNYYDVLRSLLEAYTSLDGYKVYSHEAFTYYLRERGEEASSQKFERARKIRNSINYYGKQISVDEAKELIKEMSCLIEKIRADVSGKI